MTKMTCLHAGITGKLHINYLAENLMVYKSESINMDVTPKKITNKRMGFRMQSFKQ
jgi:hypothetical protein